MENITNLTFIIAEYEKIMKHKADLKEKRKKYDMSQYVETFKSKLTTEQWSAKKAQYNKKYYENKQAKLKAVS
jgi:hypothetical protein